MYFLFDWKQHYAEIAIWCGFAPPTVSESSTTVVCSNLSYVM